MTYAEHFSKEEFRSWADEMSARLVTMLDVLRFMCGHPIEISKHEDALGRELGLKELSAHNVERWLEVLAADVFVQGVYYREQAEWIVDLAVKIGFTGVGVYSDTNNNKGVPQVMFHFDVRPTEKMGSPATWGRVWDKDSEGKIKVDQKGKKLRKYTSLIAAIQSLPLGGRQ